MQFLRVLARAVSIGLVALGFGASDAAAAEPLSLEAKIPLDEVAGRIDHLAYDSKRGRLIVAELGNNSVSILDLDQRRVVHRIPGLKTPQGVAYLAATDTIYVAGAGDGLVLRFKADDFVETGRTDLGDDADNIRIDPATNQLVVGYGAGGLAVIEGVSPQKGATKGAGPSKGETESLGSDKGITGRSRQTKGTGTRIPLPVHPEGFQLDPAGRRIFVNLAGLGQVGVVDRQSGKLAATWRAPGFASNFPMAIDGSGERVLVAFRSPPRLVAFDANSGVIAATVDVCGDPDDLVADARRRRLYLTCGAGAVDVLEQEGTGYRRAGRIVSGRGARTGLYVPERDRLYVAAPAIGREPAAILVFRPSP
jgi:DNA-binding beta-propeller fold protein YncE